MCNIDLENLLNAIGISDDYSQKIINEYNLWCAEENVSLNSISAETKLSPEVLEDSLKLKDQFMKTYFPELGNVPVLCESWMLSPLLEDVLPEDSKIRWFRSLFDIVEFLPDEEWYLEFIFNLEYFQWKDGLDIHSLTEETSLQRGVKQLLLEGKKIGAALGYLHTS